MCNSGNVYGNPHSYFYFLGLPPKENTEIMEISKADWKLYCERVSDWQAGTLYGAAHQGICRITHISWECIGPFWGTRKENKTG